MHRRACSPPTVTFNSRSQLDATSPAASFAAALSFSLHLTNRMRLHRGTVRRPRNLKMMLGHTQHLFAGADADCHSSAMRAASVDLRPRSLPSSPCILVLAACDLAPTSTRHCCSIRSTPPLVLHHKPHRSVATPAAFVRSESSSRPTASPFFSRERSLWER